MKKIGITTDSHSGILSEEAQRLGIKVLPVSYTHLQMDFVSDVSHEFKTPINAIEGYTMLLQGEELLSLIHIYQPFGGFFAAHQLEKALLQAVKGVLQRKIKHGVRPVSYTHLDVYKRQFLARIFARD